MSPSRPHASSAHAMPRWSPGALPLAAAPAVPWQPWPRSARPSQSVVRLYRSPWEKFAEAIGFGDAAR